ncbi:DNA-binding protein [Acuticoccus sediminis]|uniref:DNA-binding protein n=1 Tax=Acuticoccus sediminis TaxID=2184697 RepID=A0A8B2NMK2_9HYPH|nr:DNA-binding protein [Acuticoccus sediminis]
MAKFIPGLTTTSNLLLKCEAANYLRISPSTFRRLEKAGELPEPVKVGPRTLYRRADLDDWLAPDSRTGEDSDSAAILAAVRWS